MVVPGVVPLVPSNPRGTTVHSGRGMLGMPLRSLEKLNALPLSMRLPASRLAPVAASGPPTMPARKLPALPASPPATREPIRRPSFPRYVPGSKWSTPLRSAFPNQL